MAGSSRRDVTFKAADGVALVGWIYPAGLKASAVIMTHGFGARKEHFIPSLALRLQAAGYAVLLYDNRGIGQSGGLPRQEINPVNQSSDYHDAFNFLATFLTDEVDAEHIAIWGTSFSGGTALVAAALDKRIKAVISQVPFVSGEIASAPFQAELLKTFADRAQITARSEETRTYVPQFPTSLQEAKSGKSMALLPTVDEYEFYQIANAHAEWENRVSLQTLFLVASFEPRAYIHRIAPTPLLMIVAQNDTSIPPQSQIEAFEKASEPKQLHVMRGYGHHDCYQGPGFEESLKVQLEFLKAYL